ncbi:MAG TPA: pseudouridine synthase, partial [Aquabacterium sp.]|uniref:pseudouridine synthase n=1 Tax=Aquabacterium sp. TaxID=1872578 RepID=UPI002E37957D
APRKRMSAAEAAQAREEAAARERAAPRRDEQAPRRDPRQAPSQERGAYRGEDRGEGRGAPRGDRGDFRDEPHRDPRQAPQGDRRAAPRRDQTPRGGTDRGRTPDRAPYQDERPEQAPRRDHRRADGHSATRASQGYDAPRPPQAPVEPREDDGRLRLSKLMSEKGLASRREADEWIEQGWVSVDGEVVSELGTRVFPHQVITIDPLARTQQAQRVTILIHKPIGYVSGQAEDGYEPAVALIRPENRWHDDKLPVQLTRGHLKNLAPAGRLDIDSTGLLVLTQDGRVAKQLIGEDSGVEKEYLVRVVYEAEPEAENVSAVVPPEAIEQLKFGLELDGRQLKPAQVSWQNEQQLRFVLREGRKRQIRRMCELVGLKVVGLKRVRMGRITLGKLPLGQWRFLRPDERF